MFIIDSNVSMDINVGIDNQPMLIGTENGMNDCGRENVEQSSYFSSAFRENGEKSALLF